jgi:hypothetical protein
MKKVTTILAFFLALATSFGDGGKSDSSEEFRTLTGESATAGNIVDEDGRIRNVVTPLLH